ncbi:MAG: 2-C-methyl-D-erythritol 4-phosphate cytidylyltransferase [Chloroflexota bacterium]|nr:2-C-methyl-D-erythritol 4-phosphate cytidylyltransferase [Chloroflexota bacterium]MDE2884203.1 2-C-methyl-D-erythritol 4-phosphate cytidylyltransferase [Chloroflexota bacterium]
MNAGAVIVAAGASTRMGSAGDKTLAGIGGEPLIARTVDVFERSDAVAAIALVVSERNLAAVAALREANGWRKTLPPLTGGKRRQDSVRAGLDALPPECEWVLVHDGARPFVTSRMIEDGLAAASATGAAIAVVPAFDTVKRVGEGGRVVETLDRSELAMVQTPQVFRRDVLERAHAEVSEDVTDDAAMVERLGVGVRTFDGARSNIKVTTPEDLLIAAAILGRTPTC